jgi:hypothetical protein
MNKINIIKTVGEHGSVGQVSSFCSTCGISRATQDYLFLELFILKIEK